MPVRAFYKCSWKPYYEKENKGLVMAIKSNQHPKDSCFFSCYSLEYFGQINRKESDTYSNYSHISETTHTTLRLCFFIILILVLYVDFLKNLPRPF